MKLYSDQEGTAPSPRRVRVFLAEKGFSVEIVPLKIHEENRTDAFAEKNPFRNLPVLELDDGTCISESVAICRYIESLQPEPRLFGADGVEAAQVEMWNRRAEFAFYLPIEYAGGFMGQDVAVRARQRVGRTAAIFDGQLSATAFLAADTLSIADITAKVALDFGMRYNGIEIDPGLTHFHRWYAAMDNCASMTA